MQKDYRKFSTAGIGGSEKVYLAEKVRIRLGEWQGCIPVGFLGRSNIPPLLGRQEFLELFKLILFRHSTYFSAVPKAKL